MKGSANKKIVTKSGIIVTEALQKPAFQIKILILKFPLRA